MSNQLNYAPFFFVWNPDGHNPKHRHATQDLAIAEAERLARANKGETFVVLEAVCARRVDDMLRIQMRPNSDVQFSNDDLPF